MGTDIRMAVEIYRDGKWTWVKDAFPCPDCNGTKVVKYGEKEPCFCHHGYRGSPGRSHGYDGRNYDAFGIIANVRNGTWGEATPFIAEPRGLPPFMDAELLAQQEDADEDADEDGYRLGEDTSWLTLAELLAFDWTQPLRRHATMSWDVFAKWDRATRPTEYCASSSDKTVKQEEAERLLAAGESAPNVRANWTETLAEATRDFYGEFLPKLSALAAEMGVGPTALRIVFGFC